MESIAFVGINYYNTHQIESYFNMIHSLTHKMLIWELYVVHTKNLSKNECAV